MLAITTTLEHTGHWTKMRQSLARFSGPESSPQTRSLADFIATTSGFRFSVHTTPLNGPESLIGPARVTEARSSHRLMLRKRNTVSAITAGPHRSDASGT